MRLKVEETTTVPKLSAIKNGEVQLVVNTPMGAQAREDEYEIGRSAIDTRFAFSLHSQEQRQRFEPLEPLKWEIFNIEVYRRYLISEYWITNY